MNAKQNIEKLAAMVCTDVMLETANLAQRLDALKILMPMYTLLTKLQGNDPVDASEFSFNKFREDLEDGLETGDRTRRRNNA